MQPRNRGHQAQPQAAARNGPAGLQPHEALQYALPVDLRNTWSPVRDHNVDGIALILKADIHGERRAALQDRRLARAVPHI